jgi:predicted nucleic acid-binding protein
MEDSLSICVVDTNLLIDLYFGKIIVPFFALPYAFIAPDVIIAELKSIDCSILIRLGLQKYELTGKQVQNVLQLRAQHRQLSVNDLFALVTAQSLKAILLTGDKNLRNLAEQNKISTHGTLWVLDEMVTIKVISPLQAAEALKLLCEKGGRLPIDECNYRLKSWLDKGQ